MLRKRLKRYGRALVINFPKEEQEIYGLKEGDIIDINDIIVMEGKGKKDGKKSK